MSDPGTYLPLGATAEIIDPAGTYSGADASVPTIDPAGTYSAAGASAPTIDPAGTYTSPYQLNRLFVDWKNITPANAVLSFHNETEVANYYGVGSTEDVWATQFFDNGVYNNIATMDVTRFGLRQRPHLLGADISSLTLQQLQAIHGYINVSFDGYNYTGYVNFAGVPDFPTAAQYLSGELKHTLPVQAQLSNASITPQTVSFTGSVTGAVLTVTSVQSGTLQIGGIVSGKGILPGTQIIYEAQGGTPGGPGQYQLYAYGGNTSSESLSETYGVLNPGSIIGNVAAGQEVQGNGVLPYTAIQEALGDGTWVVDQSQSVSAGALTTTAPPLSVILDWNNSEIVGKTKNHDFFDIAPRGNFGFDVRPSDIGYATDAVADELGLSQAAQAITSSPGGSVMTWASFMNNIINHETNQFGSFQTDIPRSDLPLETWSGTPNGFGYEFLPSGFSTPAAGSSQPVLDPPGTYSNPGASKPTAMPSGGHLLANQGYVETHGGVWSPVNETHNFIVGSSQK